MYVRTKHWEEKQNFPPYHCWSTCLGVRRRSRSSERVGSVLLWMDKQSSGTARRLHRCQTGIMHTAIISMETTMQKAEWEVLTESNTTCQAHTKRMSLSSFAHGICAATKKSVHILFDLTSPDTGKQSWIRLLLYSATTGPVWIWKNAFTPQYSTYFRSWRMMWWGRCRHSGIGVKTRSPQRTSLGTEPPYRGKRWWSRLLLLVASDWGPHPRRECTRPSQNSEKSYALPSFSVFGISVAT